MFAFFSSLPRLLILFFFAVVKTIYSIVARILFMTSIIVLVMGPAFFLIFVLKNGNPLFILYFAGALIWPIVLYAIVLKVFRPSRTFVSHRYKSNDSAQYSNAADEMLYGSNQPIYSPLALVNSEIPYTNEHFAKYGSMD